MMGSVNFPEEQHSTPRAAGIASQRLFARHHGAIVGRKVMAVVGQNRDVAHGSLPVSGIGRYHVNLVSVERGVKQSQVHGGRLSFHAQRGGLQQSRQPWRWNSGPT